MAEDDGSIFKAALIGAPIVVGGGLAYRNIRRAGFGSMFSEPVLPAFSGAEAVRGFVSQYREEGLSQAIGASKRWSAGQLRDLATGTTLSATQIRESFMYAAQAADPSGHLGMILGDRLALATTGEQALRDAAQFLESNTSVYAARAGNIFADEISILHERAEKGLGLATTPIIAKVPRRGRWIERGTLFDAYLEKMREATGAQIRMKEWGRHGIEGAELHLEFTGGRLPANFTLRIPRAIEGGTVVRGTTQQSRYIAGQYGIIEGGRLVSTLNHEQFTMRRAVEELIPGIMTAKNASQREIRRMVSEFETRMMEAPEWIPSIPTGTHGGVDVYTNLRSQVMRLYTPGEMPGELRGLTEFEYAQLMRQGGAFRPEGAFVPMFPGHSPSLIARGVVSTIDPRAGALFPGAVPTARRPLQHIRSGFTPTAGALEVMAADPFQQAFGWAADPRAVPTPMVKAAYVPSSMMHKLAGTGVTSEGQFLVANELAAKRAVRQWQQFDIATARAGDIAGLLGGGGGQWDINQAFAKGTFLGRDPSGRAVLLPEDMFITHAMAFEKDKAKGDFIRIMAMRDVEDLEWSKVYGGAKGMARGVPASYIHKILTERLGVHHSGIQALITMDELKKNRALHYNQMFTQLWEFSNMNMQAGFTQSRIASNFAKNPMKIISAVNRIAQKGDLFQHEAALGAAMRLAKLAKLTPQQMGGVFGAVPEVFDISAGELGKQFGLSPYDVKEIAKGVPTGATQLFFGETVGAGGAGRMATIEPRAYELLGAPHFGAAGPQIQAEIAARMMAEYPERLMEQRELTEALKSVQTLKKRQGAIAASEILSTMTKTDLLPQQATNLRIGGIGDIYIPGAAQVSQLAGFKTAAGGIVEPELAHAYSGVIEAAQEYEKRNITADVMRGKLAGLETELSAARMATVAGTGGLLRGRLPGSAFLRAVEPTLRERLPAGVVGITAPYAKQMFREMGRLGLYEEQELEAMKRRFMSGERVAGLLGRHPYIGPYSSQVVNFQLVAGEAPIAMIDERMRRAITLKGRLQGEALENFEMGARNAFKGNQYMLRRLNQIGGEMLGSPLRLSPFVGLAADVDGDQLAAMFAGPQLEKSLSSHLADKDALRLYEEYSIRSQVLKAKAAGGSIAGRMEMAGAGIKLGITEGGRLGRLSTSLQQYKVAVLSGMGGLGKQEAMNALGLLEWMEQVPIAGKHIAPGSEERMIHLLDNIQLAIDRKNANGIADAAKIVLENAKASGKAALREGFTVAMEDLEAGEMVTRYIPGIDINKAAQNITKAQRAYEAAEVGGISMAKLRRLVMGRAKAGTKEAAALMDPAVLEKTLLGAFSTEGAPKGLPFSELAQRAGTALNKVGAAGRSMLTHARPLALGTGIGLGVAALLSEPPRIVPPGDNTPPKAILKSGTGGAKMDANIHPTGQMPGAPSARNPVESQNTARIASPEGYNVSIRGNVAQPIDYRNLTEQLRQGIGGRTRINSSVKDLRSSLTPQKLSSILRDE